MLAGGRGLGIGWIALALCLLGGCTPGEGRFEIVGFEQEGRRDVRLNEPLLFRFTGPVDPTSVNSSTSSIVDDRGVAARGTWSTAGTELRFLPDHPTGADSAGAGLAFGRNYRIVFAGYPMHGTVLSTDGRVLESKAEFEFSTLGREDARDPVPAESPRLIAVDGIPLEEIPYRGLEIPPDEGFVMEFSEPLHPASVLGGGLRLHGLDEEGVSPAGTGIVALECSFVSGLHNRVVRARPIEPLEPGRRYNLRSESIGFKDFGGNGMRVDSFNFIQFRCRE
jgi:hypothetical protein